MRSSKQYHARGHRAKSKQQDNSKEFDKYYSGVYGSRWPTLREALLKPTVHAAVYNSFIHAAANSACTDAGLLPILGLGHLHAYRRAKSTGPYPPSPLDSASALRVWYWLDLASVLPVLLLQPQRGHHALDMCAAPGGKSVMLAQRLFAPPPPSRCEATGPAVQAAAAGAAMAAAAGRSPVADAAATAQGPSRPGTEAECGAAVATASTEAGAESGEAAETPSTSGRQQAGGNTGVQELQSRELEHAEPSADTARAQPPSSPPPSQSPQPLPLPLPPGKLVCNEPDRPRLQRLRQVLEEYLPLSVRGNVEVLGYQGHTYWGRNQAASYDRVLVDAPCSSDRHVIQQATTQQRGAVAAADWSLAGCRRIADEQLQNDEVVERLLRRCDPGAVRVVPAMEVLRNEVAEVEAKAGQGTGGEDVAGVLGMEATKHGAICLPDRSGWGPIYVAVVEKVGEVAGMGAAALLRPRPTGGVDKDEEEEDADDDHHDDVENDGEEEGV
ncbi:hypothetical protein VOLCADRAFT_103645 [Volvox carteri f. nagariensis]|uniref:SAM-dependent MTase RsmB/NOP-type domain-containing protein n=1 Tax=Volvox carteri f. nagariensis TaxID=3068 RepID=D8TNL3_VOLCA|nr:uncharacterized protein VOLCADRAFT_103645 [Volvox carteri f. nagariensis]EFJ51010.1 hypothetical protein VOLCADRAFT_103645 [Volvox carteri f. nagariensis]|eukprot:XP_002948022.1 hypothetical protein VOLCADRAFT_103645 [Volvox carteri f. nagariensis]